MVAKKSRRFWLCAAIALLISGAGVYSCWSLPVHWTFAVGVVSFVLCMNVCERLRLTFEANVSLLYKPVPYGGQLVYARASKQLADKLFVVPKHRLYSLRSSLDAASAHLRARQFDKAEASACWMLPELRRSETQGAAMVQMGYAILWQSCEAASDDTGAEYAWKRRKS